MEHAPTDRNPEAVNTVGLPTVLASRLKFGKPKQSSTEFACGAISSA
jgi:hypothetical protein